MGMLQRYRNKLKQVERQGLRKRKESGDVVTTKIKVRVPSMVVKKGKK
jgi:hypothetical protein